MTEQEVLKGQDEVTARITNVQELENKLSVMHKAQRVFAGYSHDTSQLALC